MAAPDQVYREFARRTHRTMAAYLAMVAWTRNLDCVAIDRREIVRFWGLSKRVENQRIDWLKGDIKQFFPHTMALWSNYASKFDAPAARRPARERLVPREFPRRRREPGHATRAR
jgi:hypothetical protein